MLMRLEVIDPNSCLNRADDDEYVFVLLGRDPAAPTAIRWWAATRIEMGKNLPDDPEIREAFEVALIMESQQSDRL